MASNIKKLLLLLAIGSRSLRSYPASLRTEQR